MSIGQAIRNRRLSGFRHFLPGLLHRSPKRPQSLHHSTSPSRNQKCERQPSLAHTEGHSVGRPAFPTRTSQRGFTCGSSISSIRRPQPQGQIKPADQRSPSSRATTTVRSGMVSGSSSSSTYASAKGAGGVGRKNAANQCRMLRNRLPIRRRIPRREDRAEARLRRHPANGSWPRRSALPQSAPPPSPPR